jgi:hypothetical protein
LWKKVVRRRQYNDDALIKKHPGANTLRSYYFLLTVLGACFRSNVLLSALAASAFIRHGGVQRRIRYLWLPIAFMRERQLAAQV